MPARSDGDSAARSAKSWPPVTCASAWPRARSGCRRPHWQEIRVSHAKRSCDVISHDLFYVIFLSSLLSAKTKKLSFFQSQIKLQPFFFRHVKNESIQRTGSYEKSPSTILLLVAVALYINASNFFWTFDLFQQSVPNDHKCTVP